MENRNRWWVIALSGAMAAYGGLVLWCLLYPVGRWTSHPDQIIIGALIALVGAYALAMEIKYQPEDAPASVLVEAVQSYASAWSKLWRTKWLLWVYGCLAGITVLDTMLFRFMSYLFLRHSMRSETSSLPHVFTLSEIPFWLASALDQVYDKFFPRIPPMTGIPLYALAVFIAAWWALSRVQRLSTDPECSGKTRLFSICLVVAGLGGVVDTVLWFLASKLIWTNLAYPLNARIEGSQRFLAGYAQLVATIIMPILTAAVIGGVIGSLARNARGEDNVKATFLRDSVRNFVPLVALYLILAAIFIVPAMLMNVATGRAMPGPAQMLFQVSMYVLGFLGLAMLSLMFAPFGIAAGGMGAWAAVKHSIGVWRRMWKQVLVLIAVGTFFSGLAMLPVRPPWELMSFMKLTWLPIPFYTIASLVGLVIRVLLLLATWEFYSTQVVRREPVLEREA